ncbi:MAG: hypothetical protein ACOZCL_01445 [Bacillota bacterium]
MYKDEKRSVLTSELVKELLTNDKLMKTLFTNNENDFVVMNNSCKATCRNLPLVLKAILCDVRININNNGATDVEITKLHEDNEPYIMTLYESILNKYYFNQQDATELINENNIAENLSKKINSLKTSCEQTIDRIKSKLESLIRLYIQMRDIDSRYYSIKERIAVLKARLEERTANYGFLYRLKGMCGSKASRYIGITRKGILELRNELIILNESFEKVQAELERRINDINSTEVELFILLNELENNMLIEDKDT